LTGLLRITNRVDGADHRKMTARSHLGDDIVSTGAGIAGSLKGFIYPPGRDGLSSSDALGAFSKSSRESKQHRSAPNSRPCVFTL